jgi:hypothetical protein
LKCAGVNISGYRLGDPCGAVAKYAHKGRYYCAAHKTIAVKEPGRFKRATQLWEKAELRRIRKERQAEAQRGQQIDLVEACE